MPKYWNRGKNKWHEESGKTNLTWAVFNVGDQFLVIVKKVASNIQLQYVICKDELPVLDESFEDGTIQLKQKRNVISELSQCITNVCNFTIHKCIMLYLIDQ